MKERIQYFLEIQDSLKIPFQFLFKGKRNIHFPLGMYLSLFINILSLCLGITLMMELIYHTGPSVNYAQFHSSMTTNMTLNTKELLFTIAIRDNNYNLINDPSIASIIATYERVVSINGNLNIEVINLDFMNCSKIYDIFKEFEIDDRFNSIGLINYNCYNASEPIIMGGKYGTEFYGNLAFYVSKCKNSSDSNIICKNEDEINNLIQNGWLQITYVSSYVDFNNYSHPIQYVTEDSYIMLDISMNKQLYIYFSPLEIHSENNLVFSNKNNMIATKHDSTTIDIISALNDGVISSIMLCPSFTVDKYYRKYIKIQEIGASIGGLYSGLSILAILLSTYHKFRYTEMKIINELFSFGSENFIFTKNSIFKYNNKKKEMEEYYSGLRDTIIFKPIDHGNIKKKLDLPVELHKVSISSNENSKRVYHYKIDLGFCKSLQLMCCKCKKKVKDNLKEYNFVLKELLKYIDYTEVCKYFMDVEKIKSILNKSKISEKWVSHKKLIVMGSTIIKKNKNLTKRLNNYINNQSNDILNKSCNQHVFQNK